MKQFIVDSNQENRTKIGKLLYLFVTRLSILVANNRAIYFVLAHTWGILMTLVGYIVSVILLLLGYRPTRYNGIYYFVVGEGWGGLELGTTFIVGSDSQESTKRHEFGHTCQNCVLGILFPFLVALPSAIRYWSREIKKSTKPYDLIWFEGSASRIGSIAKPLLIEEQPIEKPKILF